MNLPTFQHYHFTTIRFSFFQFFNFPMQLRLNSLGKNFPKANFSDSLNIQFFISCRDGKLRRFGKKIQTGRFQKRRGAAAHYDHASECHKKQSPGAGIPFLRAKRCRQNHLCEDSCQNDQLRKCNQQRSLRYM